MPKLSSSGDMSPPLAGTQSLGSDHNDTAPTATQAAQADPAPTATHAAQAEAGTDVLTVNVAVLRQFLTPENMKALRDYFQQDLTPKQPEEPKPKPSESHHETIVKRFAYGLFVSDLIVIFVSVQLLHLALLAALAGFGGHVSAYEIAKYFMSGHETTVEESDHKNTVSVNAEKADAYNTSGLFHELKGRWRDAEAFYKLAVASNPNEQEFRFNQARMLMNLGRFDEALATITAFATIEKAESASYLYAAAAVYIRKRDVETGKRLMEGARAMALRFGQASLALTIESDLKKLK